MSDINPLMLTVQTGNLLAILAKRLDKIAEEGQKLQIPPGEDFEKNPEAVRLMEEMKFYSQKLESLFTLIEENKNFYDKHQNTLVSLEKVCEDKLDLSKGKKEANEKFLKVTNGSYSAFFQAKDAASNEHAGVRYQHSIRR